jgi:hypothetical protein
VIHRARFLRLIPVLAILGLIVASLVSVPQLGNSADAAKGNNQNAKLCQKGGWQTLQTSGGIPFSSEEECVSAGAQGAGVVPIPPPTQVPPTETPMPPTETPIPPTETPAPVGTVALSYRFSTVTRCYVYVNLAGWASDTTYTLTWVVTSSGVVIGGGTVPITTNGAGAASMLLADINKSWPVTATVNGVTDGPENPVC